MEAAELYILAARYKARRVAVLTISDHVVTGEALDAQTGSAASAR
jgi:purine-nucleoside phosphorylase